MYFAYTSKTIKSFGLRHLGIFFLYFLLFVFGYYFLNRVVTNPQKLMEDQLLLSKVLVAFISFHIIFLVFIDWKRTKYMITTYFSESGSTYNLAIFRIIYFFILGGHFFFYTIKYQISWTYLPDSSKVGLPFINWLVHILPVSPEIYTVFSILAGVACWCICLGLGTRYSFFILIPTAFYVIGVPMFYGKLSHSHILFWVPILLCFAPVADVWSIDAWICRRKGRRLIIEDHPKYILPFKFLWIQLAIIYFFAGIIKLWDCGLDWALGDNMINQMRWEWVEHYDKVPKFRLDNYPTLAHLCGIAVICFEILYVLLIFNPKIRIWAFISAFAFHLLCGYFMYIDFSNLRFVAISYIPWDKIGNRIYGNIKLPNSQITGSTNLPFGDKKYYYVFISASLLVIANFWFSVFKVHSYPFSSYPTYSSIVTDRIKTVEMVVYDFKSKVINVKELGEKAKFRWENIRPYEVRISECFENGDEINLKSKLSEYWLLWKNNVSGLNDVKRIDLFLLTSSIIPERRNQIIEKKYLGTLNF